ncbi:pentapeptide repeat-containing protein [Paenibacillus sp. SC116]|uniref:pentapeptide repeat-containing protein n=1 Tax=Paenibacillus sp. SC116 TaxID=2968986 RepID=UPI00215A2104|nr:pentapeptide repeat-containing protein [Paenibacillus sp. SC116]MCR8843956.1 pentapeptide repeat-containing protein [Paenibacillus sp. SC116]
MTSSPDNTKAATSSTVKNKDKNKDKHKDKGNSQHKRTAPKLPQALDCVPASELWLADEQMLSYALYQDGIIEHQNAASVSFEKVIFQNVTFRDMSLPKLELTDVRFDNCDLSNVDFSGVIAHRVEFRNCKLMGIDLLSSTLRHLSFQRCLGDYATFRFANIKHTEFIESSFVKSDFYHSVLSDIYFKETNIDQAQFSSTKLAGIDISGCHFFNLGVTLEDLKGCMISPAQAITLSKIFGLIIKE